MAACPQILRRILQLTLTTSARRSETAGQSRPDESWTRFEEEVGNIDGLLRQWAEGSHIQDLIVETAQCASVADAHDGGPP